MDEVESNFDTAKERMLIQEKEWWKGLIKEEKEKRENYAALTGDALSCMGKELWLFPEIPRHQDAGHRKPALREDDQRKKKAIDKLIEKENSFKQVNSTSN